MNSSSVNVVELDETALSQVVGGNDDDLTWADYDDQGFFGFDVYTVHELDCPDDFCDTIG